jgi:hypothetical protein
MALLQVLGYDWGEYCRGDIELPLRPARERAQHLLGASLDTDRDWNVAYGTGVSRETVLERLRVLASDAAWLDRCGSTLEALRLAQLNAISRWSSTVAILKDDAQFAAITRSLILIERENAFIGSTVSVWDQTRTGPQGRHLQELVDHWQSLSDGFRDASQFWAAVAAHQGQVDPAAADYIVSHATY